MPLIEKNGGYWFDDVNSGYLLVFEHHDEQADLIGAVHFKPPDVYLGAVFEKAPDWNYNLPMWVERRPDALFSDKAEAIAYVRGLLGLL